MTYQDLGAIGEFLGFFAVLATLGYLAQQTRVSQRATRVQSVRDVLNDFQLLWSNLQNPTTSAVVRTAVNDWDALSYNEQMIAHSFFVGLLVHLTNALELEEHLPELGTFIVGWEDNVLGMLQTDGGSKWWAQANYLFLPIVKERIAKRTIDPKRLPPAWTAGMKWWTLDQHDSR